MGSHYSSRNSSILSRILDLNLEQPLTDDLLGANVDAGVSLGGRLSGCRSGHSTQVTYRNIPGERTLRTVDENGRFLGGNPVPDRLPLRSNEKPWEPNPIKLQNLGNVTVGMKNGSAAVWRVQ